MSLTPCSGLPDSQFPRDLTCPLTLGYSSFQQHLGMMGLGAPSSPSRDPRQRHLHGPDPRSGPLGSQLQPDLINLFLSPIQPPCPRDPPLPVLSLSLSLMSSFTALIPLIFFSLKMIQSQYLYLAFSSHLSCCGKKGPSVLKEKDLPPAPQGPRFHPSVSILYF